MPTSVAYCLHHELLKRNKPFYQLQVVAKSLGPSQLDEKLNFSDGSDARYVRENHF